MPEPFTLEPCESYSKDDIDEYVAVLRQISKEAYENPDLVKNSPYNSVGPQGSQPEYQRAREDRGDVETVRQEGSEQEDPFQEGQSKQIEMK